MHELSITQAVVEQVRAKLGDVPVRRIRLSVGALSGVVPDAMRFCFEMVCAGSPMEGAELEIDEPPGQARCRDCGAEFETTEALPLCVCGSADIALAGGQELRILSVELTEEVVEECVRPADAHR